MPILNCSPLKIDLPSLMQKLRLRDGSTHASMLQELVRQAEELAQPKAVYDLAFIDARGKDWVKINGIRFSSRILRVNVAEVHRVFPYVITCGVELEQWSRSLDDFLMQFFADAIKEYALHRASETLKFYLDERYQPGPLSSMNPGSLGDFPLTVQRDLFSLLGDVHAQIGVSLTSSFLMLPTKSVSGILFPTERGFVNCQLCPRQNCPSRRALYDPELYQAKYAPSIEI